MPPLTPKVYHERQTRQLCALHTLNNLFQCKLVFQCKYALRGNSVSHL